jgi:ribosomal small subunit protein bTHX
MIRYEGEIMGRGDSRTAKGKRTIKSFGNSRKKKAGAKTSEAAPAKPPKAE